MAASTDRSYRPAGGVATIAQLLLYATVGLAAVSALLALMRGLDPFRSSPIEALLWVVQFVVWLAAFVATLRWIYLANVNARALGADDMIVSPGWAVGWFFVPLMNLAMPFIAIREMWKASANPRDWQAGSAPLIIPLWWGFWLAAGITASLAFRLDLEFGKEAGSASDTLYFASDLFTIPALLLLARIIAGIQAMQSRLSPGSAETLKDRFA